MRAVLFCFIFKDRRLADHVDWPGFRGAPGGRALPSTEIVSGSPGANRTRNQSVTLFGYA